LWYLFGAIERDDGLDVGGSKASEMGGVLRWKMKEVGFRNPEEGRGVV
jgi:hypothetical protein